MAIQENLVDLEVVKNDTKTWKLTVTDADGTAIDISGYLVFFTVKQNLSDEDVNAIIKQNVVCPSDADSIAGICRIALTSTDTNVAIGTYYYDIKMQKNSGGTIVWRKTIATGKFRVNLTATKRTT